MPSPLKRVFPLLGLCAVLSGQTGTVEGDVTGGGAKKPIAGARIRLQDGERLLFTRSDENGHFQFLEVSFGSHAMAAQRLGCIPISEGAGTRTATSWATLSPDHSRAEVH